MNEQEIFAHVDHTLLKPDAGWNDIRLLCREAVRFGAASVCVPPAFVARVRASFPMLTIGTVVGFPLGYQTSGVKVYEAARAVACGADEIDLMINLSDVRDKAFHRILSEIREVRETIGNKVLKVIVETCYLEENDKRELARVVEAAGADYIKTSTGFGPAGAELEDVTLFRSILGPEVSIKAAGGIRTREAMETFLAAGCKRLGVSGGVQALFGAEASAFLQELEETEELEKPELYDEDDFDLEEFEAEDIDDSAAAAPDTPELAFDPEEDPVAVTQQIFVEAWEMESEPEPEPAQDMTPEPEPEQEAPEKSPEPELDLEQMFSEDVMGAQPEEGAAEAAMVEDRGFDSPAAQPEQPFLSERGFFSDQPLIADEEPASQDLQPEEPQPEADMGGLQSEPEEPLLSDEELARTMLLETEGAEPELDVSEMIVEAPAEPQPQPEPKPKRRGFFGFRH